MSSGGVFTEEILKSLNKNPVIFAMANPEPEIWPEIAKSAGLTVLLQLDVQIILIK